MRSICKNMAKSNKKVRVALVGVGNCAAALVQGVHYYKNAADDAEIPGLMHARWALPSPTAC